MAKKIQVDVRMPCKCGHVHDIWVEALAVADKFIRYQDHDVHNCRHCVCSYYDPVKMDNLEFLLWQDAVRKGLPWKF